ncbi:MAG: hypothetical protein NUV97_01330 [archaeon]|nr:hypothetical protein [archaeon]MCR4323395.1 hypothetical protein [Nanoarchaeota archaeon]
MAGDREVSDIEKLMARSTINFPRSIDHKEVGGLLTHVARGIGPATTINYRVSSNENIVPERNNLGSLTGKHISDPGSATTSGNISTSYGEGSGAELAIISFDLKREHRTDIRGYDSMKFFTTPGYSLEELNPTELRLMDNVRAQVRGWFGV